MTGGLVGNGGLGITGKAEASKAKSPSSRQKRRNSMKLQPLFARVLLERERVQQIGRIILPDSVADRHASLKCRVLAVGPTCDPEIKELVGKSVLIGKNAGTWLNADGNTVPKADEATFFMVQEQDILCAVEDEAMQAAAE